MLSSKELKLCMSTTSSYSLFTPLHLNNPFLGQGDTPGYPVIRHFIWSIPFHDPVETTPCPPRQMDFHHQPTIHSIHHHQNMLCVKPQRNGKKWVMWQKWNWICRKSNSCNAIYRTKKYINRVNPVDHNTLAPNPSSNFWCEKRKAWLHNA